MRLWKTLLLTLAARAAANGSHDAEGHLIAGLAPEELAISASGKLGDETPTIALWKHKDPASRGPPPYPFPASRNGRRSALSASSAAASSHASSSSAPHARRFEPSGTFWNLPAGDDGALLLPPIGPPIGPTPPPAVPTPRPLSSVFTRRTSLPYSSICLASCRFFPASDRHSVSTACLGSSRRNLYTQHDVSPNLEL